VEEQTGTQLDDYAYLRIRGLVCLVAVWFPIRHMLAVTKAGVCAIVDTVLLPCSPTIVGKDGIPLAVAG